MKDSETAKLVDEISSNPAPVILYGAGFYCRLGIGALKNLNIQVDAICDSDIDREGTYFYGYEIISPKTLKTYDREAHVFVVSIFVAPILQLLTSLAFRNVYDCTNLFENTNFSEIDLDDNSTGKDSDYGESRNIVNINRQIGLYKHEILKILPIDSNELHLKYIDIVITEACSMKCIDCSNLMQYYINPKHSDIDILFRSLDQVITTVDHIYELRVLGGEPFVNKQIYKIIDKLVSYENVDKIVIYTNATIVPKERNLSSLKNDKVFLDITDYGQLSRNLDKLIGVLELNSISYIAKKPIWTDSGRILPFREKTKTELNQMFLNCCNNDVMTLLNGKIYRCPFSANGTNIGAIPYNEDDIVDLSEQKDSKTLKSELKSLYTEKDYLTACSYCNGRDYSTPKIVPAIQTKVPLPIPK